MYWHPAVQANFGEASFVWQPPQLRRAGQWAGRGRTDTEPEEIVQVLRKDLHPVHLLMAKLFFTGQGPLTNPLIRSGL